MKNILHIYKTDLRNIARVPTGILLMLALAALPSVYAWINLKAMWDPYSNTSGIKIALTSNDKGATIKGTTFNIGEEVVRSLKDNRQLGWTFVDEAEALRGVIHGDYFASLLIPSDFSSKITTVLEGKPQKPEIIYTVNEKLNAVAPKITAKGATTVTETISDNFIKTVSETVLGRLKELGIEFEQQLPTIRKLESKVLDLEQHLTELGAVGNKTLEMEQRLPELKDKGNRIVELESQLPRIEQAGDTILKLEERWPRIQAAADEVLAIRERLPDIQRVANYAVELDQNVSTVEQALLQSVDNARKADAMIRDALDILPKLETIAVNGGAFADQLQQFVTKNEAAFQAIPPVVHQNLLLAQQASAAVPILANRLQAGDWEAASMTSELTAAADRLTAAAAALGGAKELMAKLAAYAPSGRLDQPISRLGSAQTRLGEQAEAARAAATVIQSGGKPAGDVVKRLNTRSSEAGDAVSLLLTGYDAELGPAMVGALRSVQATVAGASDVLQQVKPKLPDLKGILQDAKTGVDYAASRFAALQTELPQIRSKIHDTVGIMQGKLGEFSNAIAEAAPFIQNDLPKVGQKVHQAADFVRNDLPQAENELRLISDMYKTKFPVVENAVHQAADFVRNDFPSFEAAVHKAAEEIRRFQGSNSLGELLTFLHRDIQQESEFLASPVVLKEEVIYPIPNYGSAMSPFYTTLSLWVGAMLLVSLLKVDVDGAGVGGAGYKSYQVYFGRMGIFLTVGLLQGLIVTLGNYYLLGTYVVHKGWFLLFVLLTSIVFVTITYTLVSVFGNIGKGVAIIFLVLQFSSSGGTFPVSTASAFFQKLNPFVPFTYAVEAMREAVGGILVGVVVKDVLFLCASIVVCYVVALLLKKPLGRFTRHMAEQAEKTKLI